MGDRHLFSESPGGGSPQTKTSIFLIAEVAFPIPVFKTFHYEIPEELRALVARGMRVRAPFGARRTLQGVVTNVFPSEPAQLSQAPHRPLKKIQSLLDSRPLLTDELLDLALWLSKRYCAPLGECLRAVFPSYVREAPPSPIPSLSAPLPGGERGRGEEGFSLTEGQEGALGRISELLDRGKFGVCLVFGVPASGKTEVYIRLARKVVRSGGQVLFMVPEISLTPPFLQEFSKRLEAPVAVWHSGLSQSLRRRTWAELSSATPRVVVGARSAGLLPFPNLRLAILDEEQDESYKEEGRAPTYHARDVALERARRQGTVVVLGSATPSIESYAMALSGEWELLRLQDRVSELKEMPLVTVVDRRRAASRSPSFSVELAKAVDARLASKEQVILLLNRRGFSRHLRCGGCRKVLRCGSCLMSMVHHKASPTHDLLRCHTCGRRSKVPAACPECGGRASFKPWGAGTQRVEEEITKLWPKARVLRMDRDTVGGRRTASERIYGAFRGREADILVGTKLVSKGFHFPDVTLVGVVDADTNLHMPDFRAAEKTVQLLTQAGGRAGRGAKKGEVILQTEEPSHYAIRAAANWDYDALARCELESRRELGYPPHGRLIQCVVSGLREESAERGAEGAAREARRLLGSSAEIVGPAPCPHERLRGRFRRHFLVKIPRGGSPEPILEKLRGLAAGPGLRFTVNADPYDLS